MRINFIRVTGRPLLTPNPLNKWEKDAVFNAAAIYENEVFYLFYRAVEHPNYSVIGLAISTDGINFSRLSEPIIKPEYDYEKWGIEDPRITKIDDTYYMYYTAWDNKTPRIAWATSKNLFKWEKQGLLKPLDLFANNKDCALLPEKVGEYYYLFHRPYPNINLVKSKDLINWEENKTILKVRKNNWDCERIGIAAPPIKTPCGWLTIYHGVDFYRYYRLGLCILDLENPEKVIWRCNDPALSPEEGWEKCGDVNNVVFSCGAVLINETLYCYYGGADKYIGLATFNVNPLLKKINS